jgi:hypothetical protein
MGKSGYIAACVRAHAMKRLLLDQDEWQRLLLTSGRDELIGRLAQRGLVSGVSGMAAVERELRGRCITAASSLVRFLSGAAYDTVRFFVYYYDLLNIETVIAHLHFGSDDSIADLLYDTGRLGMVHSELLAAATSFPALGKSLKGSVLYDAYNRGLELYERDGDVAAFLAELEFDFLRGWSQAERRSRRGRISKSVFDVYLRIKTADAMMRLRFRRESGEHAVDRWNGLVPGGLLGRDIREWRGMESESDAFGYLAERIFGRHSDIAVGSDSAGDETQLLRGLLAETRRSQRRGEFSVDYLLGFLFRLMLQAEDLVRLLECRDFGLDSNLVAGYMIGGV